MVKLQIDTPGISFLAFSRLHGASFGAGKPAFLTASYPAQGNRQLAMSSVGAIKRPDGKEQTDNGERHDRDAFQQKSLW